MTLEITYIADDGTEFDTEEECRAYENEFNDLLASVEFFDENFILIRKVEDVESDVTFMYIRDAKKAKKLFPRLCDYISFESPDYVAYETGDTLWFNDVGCWVNVDAEIKRLNTIRRTIIGSRE